MPRKILLCLLLLAASPALAQAPPAGSGQPGLAQLAHPDAGNPPGVRFYFGPEKSLIRRHREDDPHYTTFNATTMFALCNRSNDCVLN